MQSSNAVQIGHSMPVTRRRGSSIPYSILRAMAAVDQTTELCILSSRAKLVLRALIKFVDAKNPSLPIFPKKATLAARLQCGVATVYRALLELEQNGLLKRLQQEWSPRSGRALTGRMQLTGRACLLLGLPTQSPNASAAPQHNVPASNLDTAACASRSVRQSAVIDGHILNQAKPDHTASEKESQSGEPLGFVRMGDKTLPADLVPLVTASKLTLLQVLRLMRMAREAGQRLSDIVAARRSGVMRRSGPALFAYLRYLTRCGTDFAAAARAQTEAANHARHQAQLRAKRDALKAAVQGRTFRSSRSGSYLRCQGDGGGSLVQVLGDPASTRPKGMMPFAEFARAWERGELVEVLADESKPATDARDPAGTNPLSVLAGFLRQVLR